MWDADGNHYEFGTAGHVTGYNATISDFAEGRDGWYLTRLSDAFGNSYSVSYWTGINPLWTYEPNPSCGYASMMMMPQTSNTGTSWIPKDITLPSGSNVHVNTGYNGHIGAMILSVDFPVLVGGISTTRTWSFQYATPQSYLKDCGYGTSLYADLQELSAINLPSELAGPPSYQFTYAKGLLVQVTLPTAGSIAYCYSMYHFHHGRAGAMRAGCAPLIPPGTEEVLPQTGSICVGSLPDEPVPELPPGDCTEDNPIRWVDNQWGVFTRTETVGTAVNLTTYTQFSMPRGESGAEPQTFTTVIYPPTDKNGTGDLGRQRAKGVLFSSSPRLIGSWPTTARYSVPGDRVGAAVEERTFETPPNYDISAEPLCTGNPSTDQGFCGSKAVRVAQSTYDYDDTANKEGDRRLQLEKTIYGASSCTGCKYHQVALTPAATWEGNGRHYDTETHSGTLGGDSRTITTDWAPVNWPSGSSTGATVLANLFNQRTESQGSSVRDQYFEFDTGNGFLKGSFVYDAGRDIAFLTCRYNDGHGNADKDFTRTFSSSSTPARTYCSDQLRLSRVRGHRRRHVRQGLHVPERPASHGAMDQRLGRYAAVLLQERRARCDDRLDPKFHRQLGRDDQLSIRQPRTRDARRPARGPDDVRLLRGPNATTAYRTTSNGSQACPVSPTNTNLVTWSHYDYDGLGRGIRERRLQPGGAVSKRFTLFDAMGNARFASEWVSDGTAETVSANLATACVFNGGNYATSRPSSAPGTYSMCFDPFRKAAADRRRQDVEPLADRPAGFVLLVQRHERIRVDLLHQRHVRQSADGDVHGGRSQRNRHDPEGRLRASHDGDRAHRRVDQLFLRRQRQAHVGGAGRSEPHLRLRHRRVPPLGDHAGAWDRHLRDDREPGQRPNRRRSPAR